MKIIVEYQGEEILLKNYNSYLSLDRTLSLFKSKEDLMESLGLNPEFDSVVILDNNGGFIPFNSKVINETLSFYEQGKGEEFINWIYDSSCDPKYWKTNAIKLSSYFILRSDELNRETINKSNPESNRLKRIVKIIKNNLEMFRNLPESLKNFRNDIVPYMCEYVTKNGTYDYAYMRKFVSTLTSVYEYELKESNIKLSETSDKEREKVLEYFKTAIHNHFYDRKQVTIDNVVIDDEREPIYDENGIKIDEKEFLEEFAVKKNLHL